MNKAGTKQTDFYSVKTGLQKKSILNVATPLGKIELPTTYSEYKKAGGLLIPHKSVQELPNKMKQVIEITSVKINEDLADKKFELPEDIVKLQKRAAASGN